MDIITIIVVLFIAVMIFCLWDKSARENKLEKIENIEMEFVNSSTMDDWARTEFEVQAFPNEKIEHPFMIPFAI